MLVRIEPLDPVMARDGRPFEAIPGAYARTMSEISPGLLAGSLRTLFHKNLKYGLTREQKKDLIKQLRIAGPLIEYKGHIYYPMPSDRIFYEQHGVLRTERLQPCKLDPGEGYFGVGVEGSRSMGLEPPLVSFHGKRYNNAPAFLRDDWMFRELLNAIPDHEWEQELERWKEWLGQRGQAAPVNSPFLQPYVKEQRVHNAIDLETSRTIEGALFSTEALRLHTGVSLIASMQAENDMLLKEIDAIHSMGGKRRLSIFRNLGRSEFGLPPWECPANLREALLKAGPGSLLRMTLATPAYFLKGWRPRWVDADFYTNDHFMDFWYPEGAARPKLRLKLKWACVDRPQPVSGWSYSREAREGREKPVRRMVPSGSVYFFEILEGSGEVLAENWLVSVSDARRRKGPLDREDGFGLAMWGIVNKGEKQE